MPTRRHRLYELLSRVEVVTALLPVRCRSRVTTCMAQKQRLLLMVMDALLELLLVDGNAPTEQTSVRLANHEHLVL